jgi:hypothetical protein
MKIKIVILLIFFCSSSLLIAQNNEIIDNNYKFKITLPSNYPKAKSEETDKQDAISYSSKSGDGKLSVMILAFKLTTIKNLADLIYTIEKDLTLNLPKRTSDYTDYDFGTYDGRSAVYKNNDFVETVYFFRTKYNDSPANYAYVLRFITTPAFSNITIDTEIKNIAASFKVIE